MNYQLAALQSSGFCFCKKGTAVVSPSAPAANCTATPACAGDSTQQCGSDIYMIVYTLPLITTVAPITASGTPSSTYLSLFSKVTYAVSGSVPCTNPNCATYL